MSSHAGFFLIFVIFNFVSPALLTTSRYYSVLQGQKFNISRATTSSKVSSYTFCKLNCIRHGPVSAISFRLSDQFCFCFHDEFAYDLPEGPTPDADFVSTRMDNAWILLLRIHKGSGVDVNETWITPGGINEGNSGVNPVTPGTFRSSLIDTSWNKFDKIKVAVYTNGAEKAHFIFDARGSTLENFYSHSNYLGGDYDDIKTAPIKYVGINNPAYPQTRRYFEMTSAFNGCSGDNGWFMVINTGVLGPCVGTDQRETTPYFLYSTLSTKQTFSTMPVADTFVIMGHIE